MPAFNKTIHPLQRAVAVCSLLTMSIAPRTASCIDVDEGEISLEQVIVTTSRTSSLIRDQPLRVEVVPDEEIEENLTVRPGNVTSLLEELPGVRLQTPASSLGGAGFSLRGMPARSTLVLIDGLPLLGTGTDSFGLLQTLPIDLARVELIKGASSALYGNSAIGGVLNLISKRPSSESALLASTGTYGAHDLSGFLSTGVSSKWSGTLTAGANHQSREDVSGSGWSEVPGYQRYTIRPRLWFNAGAANSLLVTAGYTQERRHGGTLPGASLPDGSSFVDAQKTQRVDGGLSFHYEIWENLSLDTRASFTSNTRLRAFGATDVSSKQDVLSAEQVLGGKGPVGHIWNLGVAFTHNNLNAKSLPSVGFNHNIPALFATDEFAVRDWLRMAGSIRVDAHNVYGTFFSPRASALFHQPDSEWSLRASVGKGFSAPTSIVEEIEATSLAALEPIGAMRAERAETISVDIKWAAGPWDLNLGLFNSEIKDSINASPKPDQKIHLSNLPGVWRAPGAELLVRYSDNPLQIIGSWTHIEATEGVGSAQQQPAPSIPRDSGEIAGILENERRGRIGIELSYVGSQYLERNPYRRKSEPFTEINFLGEIRFGEIAVFLNAINLTDVRQTRFDPVIGPVRGLGGNPVTELWAPLDGRVYNIGIRMEL